jgi:hypothetical protein
MECAAGTDAIKVTPKGCKPVSKDRCASGFMASAENVTFPKDPLETCCKCKEGEKCAYCVDEECESDDEDCEPTVEGCKQPRDRVKYVTDKDCFATPPATQVSTAAGEEEEVVVESSFLKKYTFTIYITIFSAIVLLLMRWLTLPKESAWKSRILITQFVLLLFVLGLRFLE